jgi:putative ABC transport system substrate-binding protein
MAAKRVGAVVIIDDATLIANAPAVSNLALQQRLPSSGWPDYAVAGGVIGYGVNFPDMFRRAATFVDKILKGTKPADLPVERATTFKTIVNLKTAKALGLDVPTATLVHHAARRRGGRVAARGARAAAGDARDWLSRCVIA